VEPDIETSVCVGSVLRASYCRNNLSEILAILANGPEAKLTVVAVQTRKKDVPIIRKILRQSILVCLPFCEPPNILPIDVHHVQAKTIPPRTEIAILLSRLQDWERTGDINKPFPVA
jgi:hypothetical protein